jgi:hypothetical protein
MKLFLSIFFILLINTVSSQSHKGIAFQAIARNSQGIVMGNQILQIRISILTDTIKNSIVYQEIKSVKSNPLGLFSVLIGVDEIAKIKTEGNFNTIKWSEGAHFIRIEIDPENHFHFIQIGQQTINYVAYSFSTDHIKSANIEGVISIAQGGTGFNNLSSLKLAMQLDKVNNNSDSNKVISKLTQAALNSKLEKRDTVSLSNRIDQKINKGEINQKEIGAGLGFMPFEMDYGAFYDTSRQFAPFANTAFAVKWKDTISNNHIYLKSNSNLEPTRVSVLKGGIYNIQYSIQANNTLIANDEISIWIRRNGAAYSNSLRQFLTGPIGGKISYSGEAVVAMNKGDYIELYISTRHNHTQLIKTNNLTNPSRPATPSAQIYLFRIQ